MINTGSAGPDLVDFLEVPEIIQKLLQSIRESELVILETLKTPRNHIIILKNEEQTKTRLMQVWESVI